MIRSEGFTLSLTLSRWERGLRFWALALSLAIPVAVVMACGSRDATATPAGTGIVQGTVWFVGAPCPPGVSPVPPCDGPYPSYEVRILRDSDESVAAIHRTDEIGRYLAVLPAGRYLVRTPAGVAADTFEETRFTVIPGDTLTLQLTVDTGIR